MSVGARRMVQELRRMARSWNGQGKLAALFARLDNERIEAYALTGNGSERLVAFHDAAVDADDTLEAIAAALEEGHIEEAQQLIALGRASLKERIEELKGLL